MTTLENDSTHNSSVQEPVEVECHSGAGKDDNSLEELTDKIKTLSLKEKTIIDKVYDYIQIIPDTRIVLLRIREVIMWLFGDLSFLPLIEKKNKTTDTKKYKLLEDVWGKSILKLRRPDLKLDNQWTNNFGQHIVEELILLTGKEFNKPMKKEHFQPDCEDNDTIWEIKTQTFHTTGTAGEKILGCPFKYIEIYDLYSKPLRIICLGGAEKVCREQYGNLPGEKCTTRKKEVLEFFKKYHIEYIGITDILLTFIK
jgi:hypothetical protein